MMSWLPTWERVIIVASGPSAQFTAPMRPIPGWAVIAINESWRLVPWADALYACDADWWIYRGGVAGFAGLKISQDERACAAYSDIRRVYLADRNAFLFDTPGHIGSGGNSAFQAINLAAQAGARRIVLIGVDMHAGAGTHWHGDHPAPLRNASEVAFRRMVAAFEAAAPELASRGVDVVNVSRGSALSCFRKATLVEAVSDAETVDVGARGGREDAPGVDAAHSCAREGWPAAGG